jgi:hypothetical protein
MSVVGTPPILRITLKTLDYVGIVRPLAAVLDKLQGEAASVCFRRNARPPVIHLLRL